MGIVGMDAVAVLFFKFTFNRAIPNRVVDDDVCFVVYFFVPFNCFSSVATTPGAAVSTTPVVAVSTTPGAAVSTTPGAAVSTTPVVAVSTTGPEPVLSKYTRPASYMYLC